MMDRENKVPSNIPSWNYRLRDELLFNDPFDSFLHKGLRHRICFAFNPELGLDLQPTTPIRGTFRYKEETHYINHLFD